MMIKRLRDAEHSFVICKILKLKPIQSQAILSLESSLIFYHLKKNVFGIKFKYVNMKLYTKKEFLQT